MQAWREKDNLLSKDRQFTVISVLGRGTSGKADDADDISSSQMFVLSLERNVSCRFLGLTRNLDLDTFGTDVVEDQLSTSRSLGIDSSSNSDLLIPQLLSLLKRLIILEKLPKVIGYLELVRIGVRVLGLAELVDFSAADFKVLLKYQRATGQLMHFRRTIGLHQQNDYSISYSRWE